MNAGISERLHLLPGRAKDQGIAALQPDTLQHRSSQRHHQEVDLFLSDLFRPATLAHVMHLGRRRNKPQDLGRNQIVVKHGLGGPQQAKSLQRKQLGVARPCTYQINFPLHASSPLVSSAGASAMAASNPFLLARECSRSCFRRAAEAARVWTDSLAPTRTRAPVSISPPIFGSPTFPAPTTSHGRPVSFMNIGNKLFTLSLLRSALKGRGFKPRRNRP